MLTIHAFSEDSPIAGKGQGFVQCPGGEKKMYNLWGVTVRLGRRDMIRKNRAA